MDLTPETMVNTLTDLARRGYVVALVTCRSGWACDVARGGMKYEHRDYGEDIPQLAVARAAARVEESEALIAKAND